MSENLPKNDGLTGLPTLHLLSSLFDELSCDCGSLGLLILDLDGFVFFIDAYGYLEGDALLKRVADALRQAIPPDVKLFRSAGDEFTVLFGARSRTEVVPLALQIRDALNQELASLPWLKRRCSFADGSELEFMAPITISGSIVFYPTHGSTLAELRSRAEEAMYRAGKRAHLGGILAIGDCDAIQLLTGPV